MIERDNTTEADDILRLQTLLADEHAPVPTEWVDEMLEKYPYFDLPLLLYLKRTPEAPDRSDRLARLAITSPDRQALALQIGEGIEQFAHFYPDEPQTSTPDTATTIDRFLDNYGTSSDKEIAALESAIFNPTPDYADVLASQEQDSMPAPADEQDERINRFIAQSRVKAQQAAQGPERQHVDEEEKQEIADAQVAPAEHQNDDKMLSESLAKMYIARKKYALALEIIENISLNYPEKSIYFADQIRFLRKLVWLENKQNINKIN